MNKFAMIQRAGCMILLIAPLAGCSKRDSNPTFETATISYGDLTQKIMASGSLSAALSVDVGSQISGRIMKINVDFNSEVKKGDVIAQIDPAIYRATVMQAEGDLANSKAALELSRLQLERVRALRATDSAPQSNLDQAVATMNQNEAFVKMKAGSLEMAKANLDYCTIVSPIDCTVTSRKVDVGQTVAASFNTPVLFTIANDLKKMHIDANISEADIGQVAVGQQVEFTVDAYPDEVFTGKTLQIRKSPTTVDNVVTYDTVIEVGNPDLKLFPGMTANVSILVAERKHVLRIPNSALRFAPPDGVKLEEGSPSTDIAGSVASSHQRLVYARSGTKTELKLKAIKIKVGISDGTSTEILEGLAEGGEVITAAISQSQSSGGGHPPGP